jgi:hypothetical protein
MPTNRTDYQMKAEECRQVADEPDRVVDRAHWLRIAEAWTVLASLSPGVARAKTERSASLELRA